MTRAFFSNVLAGRQAGRQGKTSLCSFTWSVIQLVSQSTGLADCLIVLDVFIEPFSLSLSRRLRLTPTALPYPTLLCPTLPVGVTHVQFPLQPAAETLVD